MGRAMTMTEELPQWAQELRLMRAESGMTQAELAKATGLHAILIAQHETGQRRPGLLTLAKYARAYEMPLKDVSARVGVK